jgi:hypothetical protein
MKSLKQINDEYETIIHRTDLDDEQKDIQLSALMIEMEQIFKIPMLRNKEYEQKNRTVISLYRKISMSRKF